MARKWRLLSYEAKFCKEHVYRDRPHPSNKMCSCRCLNYVLTTCTRTRLSQFLIKKLHLTFPDAAESCFDCKIHSPFYLHIDISTCDFRLRLLPSFLYLLELVPVQFLLVSVNSLNIETILWRQFCLRQQQAGFDGSKQYLFLPPPFERFLPPRLSKFPSRSFPQRYDLSSFPDGF